jgi:hypothetical protein
MPRPGAEWLKFVMIYTRGTQNEIQVLKNELTRKTLAELHGK